VDPLDLDPGQAGLVVVAVRRSKVEEGQEEEGDLEKQTEEETETVQKQDRDGAITLTYPALVDWINRRRLRILACIFSTVDLDSKEEGPQPLHHLVCLRVQEE